jgi:hypothetical protein
MTFHFLERQTVIIVVLSGNANSMVIVVIKEYGQRNFLLGTYDVPLTGVGSVWLTDGGPVRRRQLIPYVDMPGKVKGLQVVCKVRLWEIFVSKVLRFGMFT